MLELAPEIEQRIAEEAARHGQQPAEYATELLRSVLPPVLKTQERPLYETASPEELAREFQAWADSHTYVTAPVIPLEALRRENLYED